jgi:hypothetical protein
MMIKETLIHSSDCRTYRDFLEIEFQEKRKLPTSRTISLSFFLRVYLLLLVPAFGLSLSLSLLLH